MNTILPLWEQMPLQSTRETAQQSEKAEKADPTGYSGNPFTDIFRSAVDAVKTTDEEKTQMEYLMATGQLDNPALLTIASAKAQLSVDLLVNLRNKSLESYNELMRISL